jgi:hypothetical protein
MRNNGDPIVEYTLISEGNSMKCLFHAISLTAFLCSINFIFAPSAKAAGVNCSYDFCIKECVQKGAHVSGCSKWCNDAMTERKNAGQCKK